MGQNLALAFELLGVGMITVFLILLLVVILGNLIVFIVNKYFPESVQPKSTGTAGPSVGSGKMAAIIAAVNIVTKGKGKVTNIEKA